MSKNTYSFHPDLKKIAKQDIPVTHLTVPIVQKISSRYYSREISDTETAVSTLAIPTRDGTSIRALLYIPVSAQRNGPCLLFFHGGGFVYNASPHHFTLARELGRMLGWKTLLVDYRLAPKYKYPTAHEDCFDTYCWLLENGLSLGIDLTRICVCGDSAGGNLAAALCLMARDRHLPIPKAQMLLYPVTDRRMNTDSYKKYTNTPVCNSRYMKKFMAMYLRKGASDSVPYLSIAETEVLSGLPAAYVETAEFDCLRDEGLAYAQALQKADVAVQSHEVKGAMHGYDIAQSSTLVRDLMARRAVFLKDAVN